MPKVSTTSTLPKISTPMALSKPKITTMPTPTIQVFWWAAIWALIDSKFTSAIMPARIVSAVPAKIWTIK